jgi:hypothetical protein
MLTCVPFRSYYLPPNAAAIMSSSPNSPVRRSYRRSATNLTKSMTGSLTRLGPY